MFFKSNKPCPLRYWLVFFWTETSVSVICPPHSKFKSNWGMHLNEYLFFTTDRPRQRHVYSPTAQWEGRMLPWVPEPSLTVRYRQTGILTLLARPLRVFGELQSFSFCLLLSFRFSAVLSVTNKKDTPRELSAPGHPDQSCSPWMTKILRESSALRATLLRTSPSSTKVADRDRQRYSARAQRSAPRCSAPVPPRPKSQSVTNKDTPRKLSAIHHARSVFRIFPL